MTGTLELTAQATNPVDVDQLDTAKPLAVVFQPFQTTLEKWEAKATSLVVTDINQKTEMAQARLARLELKEARCTLEKTRKGMVENLKARTTKIDTAARTIREKMEALEATLLQSEQFAEQHAEKLKAELKQKREMELAPFIESPIVIDLSVLTEDAYAKVLNDAKMLRQAKLDAAAKAEADQKAKEEADRIERERIATENVRLKAEAEEREKQAEVERKRIEAERAEERRKAKEEADRIAAERAEERKKAEAEREAIEAKAKAEREKAAKEAAKLKAELEAKAKEEADRKAQELAAAEAERARVEVERAAAEEARRVAAAAPDKAKLQAFATAIRQLVIPGLNNAEVKNQLHDQTIKFAAWVEAQIPKL